MKQISDNSLGLVDKLLSQIDGNDLTQIEILKQQNTEMLGLLEMHIYALDNGQLKFYEKYGFNISELSSKVRALIKSSTELK